MNLREIECFIPVADELHSGKAARRLHLAQPTVSESVRRLERCLGGPLFDRSKVGLQARRSNLKHPDRIGQVPQPPRPQIKKIDSAEQTRC